MTAQRGSQGTVSVYGWMVMACSAVRQNDREAVDTWLNHAVRAFGRLETLDQHTFQAQFCGDLLVCRAWLSHETGATGRALKQFGDAIECHLKANAHTSAALDHLLRARCALAIGMRESAAVDLSRAAEMLQHQYCSPCDSLLSGTPLDGRLEMDSVIEQNLQNAVVCDQQTIRSVRSRNRRVQWN